MGDKNMKLTEDKGLGAPQGGIFSPLLLIGKTRPIDDWFSEYKGHTIYNTIYMFLCELYSNTPPAKYYFYCFNIVDVGRNYLCSKTSSYLVWVCIPAVFIHSSETLVASH